jgi:predicted GH43/DUF377 family glycosyl hydrolase
MPPAPVLRKLPVTLRPDPARVLIRPFWPANEPRAHSPIHAPRAMTIIMRILALSEEEAEQQWRNIRDDFAGRHLDLDSYFLRRFQEVAFALPTDAPLTDIRKLLIGSYFTHEYSLEAAALFNPSIVACPDQSGIPEGALRFVLSLRAVGEGHISSITFRCGTLTEDFSIDISEPARWVVEAQRVVDSFFAADWFRDKARELGVESETTKAVLNLLPDRFTEAQLQLAVLEACGPTAPCRVAGERLLMLAKSNFSVFFTAEQRFSERAIFPVSPSQTNGIEDTRFVRFTEDDGSFTYYATYTAYDGRMIFPQLLETKDFLGFHFRTLQGAAVQNKGMALFPRRIGGRYAMLSRQDDENIRIMFSDTVDCWETSEILARPAYPWEFNKLGNCGSPIELDAGWLVMTHGVGAMRKYCIGAMLLDKDDPTKIIGRLQEPLLRPAPEERAGYVPNVVYTCGGLVHRDHMLLPYATSDWYTSFAIIEISELLRAMSPA